MAVFNGKFIKCIFASCHFTLSLLSKSQIFQPYFSRNSFRSNLKCDYIKTDKNNFL